MTTDIVIVHPSFIRSPGGRPFLGDLKDLNLLLASDRNMFLDSMDSVDPGVLICSGSRVGLVARSELKVLGGGTICHRLYTTPSDHVCKECLARLVMET